jgi:hypothetical protein
LKNNKMKFYIVNNHNICKDKTICKMPQNLQQDKTISEFLKTNSKRIIEFLSLNLRHLINKTRTYRQLLRDHSSIKTDTLMYYPHQIRSLCPQLLEVRKISSWGIKIKSKVRLHWEIKIKSKVKQHLETILGILAR